jgi:hypothetical protein
MPNATSEPVNTHPDEEIQMNFMINEETGFLLEMK